LEEALIACGGEIAAAYSKRVTCVVAKDPTENSTKLQKAHKDGANIISLADAWELVG
jgi:NAD-dependent DNA ligase